MKLRVKGVYGSSNITREVAWTSCLHWCHKYFYIIKSGTLYVEKKK